MRKLAIGSVILINIFTLSLPVLAADAKPTASANEAMPSAFSDVSAIHVNYVAIKFLKDHNILGGYSDGTFKPSQLVNRAEALKIILAGSGAKLPDSVDKPSFSDVKKDDWFAKYVESGKSSGIVKGNPDGTFAPNKKVSRAEFLKMLLVLNNLKTDKWAGKQLFNDVPKDAWFASYMNYAGQAGLLISDTKKQLYPARELTRADVAEIIYLLQVIRGDQNTQFLVDQAEAQMAEVEIYVGANNPVSAKRASELAVDFSQQALLTKPNDKVVLGAAKLAKAYDYLMTGFIAAIKKDYVSAKNLLDKASSKADEAIKVNADMADVAGHIKDRAKEVAGQFPK